MEMTMQQLLDSYVPDIAELERDANEAHAEYRRIAQSPRLPNFSRLLADAAEADDKARRALEVGRVAGITVGR
jgi:hypothetical protein